MCVCVVCTLDSSWYVCVLCVRVHMCVPDCMECCLFATCLPNSDALREYQEEKATYLTCGEMKKKGILRQESELRIETRGGEGGYMW